jgi:ribonucleoside-triphosphate reductase
MKIAYETSFDEKKYLTLLKKRTTLCCKTLDIIRSIIQRNIEKGLLPNYQDGAMEMSKQYCTVGILGLYEVIEAFGYVNTDEFGYKSYSEKGIELASKIFETINEIKDNFTNSYSLNCESVPAERAAIVLCQKDNLLFDKHDKFIYSNQWIPLSEKCTIQEKIRLSSILDKKCSGGAIAHINIENNFPNKETAWDMLNYIAKNGVMYFAFNSKINECKNHHGFVGTNICPECGEGVFDTYQRIVGYLSPTRSYSKDRFNEFNTRKWYDYAESTLGLMN